MDNSRPPSRAAARPSDLPSYPLRRTPTLSSNFSQPMPGRTMGRLFKALGTRLEDLLPSGTDKGPAPVPIIQDTYATLSEIAEHSANFDSYIRERLLKSSMDTLRMAQGRWNAEYGQRLTPAVNCFLGQLKDIRSLFEEVEKKLLILHDLSTMFNILATTQLSPETKDLDGLYQSILQTILSQSAQDTPEVQGVLELYASLSLKKPLSFSGVQLLLENHDQVVKCAKRHLRPLVQSGDSITAQDIHPSFPAFLVRRFSGSLSHGLPDPTGLAIACFQLMNAQLKQNICGLADDATLNKDIPAGVIARHISDGLQYAVCHGMDHLLDVQASGPSPILLEAVCTFVDQHLLHWIEALSLSGGLKIGNKLLQVSSWLEVKCQSTKKTPKRSTS
ncbi:hypothetical protein BOTBODRAFT_192776 [Botryobasidium botryosum FD-172 SS1]|uniref:Uncharacterized protein n=1 Tax=Botryobasidium botryosum (strain FD-172 SS1) TaxID=930990 RepID=A0A067LUC8_BOTB1|nr:hypothetical protein BOTBODRAFT_192776 [Botryobasidium botryosum FD-172 SS1]